MPHPLGEAKILGKKFREAGEAAAEIVANCFGSESRDLRIWAWYCRHFDRRRIVDRAYFYASCERCGEIRDAGSDTNAAAQSNSATVEPTVK